MMQCRLIGLAAAVAVLAFFAGTRVHSQDKPAPTDGAPADKQDAMMQAWVEAAAVGPHHKALEAMAGQFTYVQKFKMAPADQWSTAEGVYEGEMCMDGRYLLTNIRGPFMGADFAGMGCLGYDNVAQKHVAAWIDNMGTGILRSEGSCDDACRTITFEGEMLCPMTRGMIPYKYQYQITSDDEFIMRWWSPHPGGGAMFESMVITATRVK